MRAVKNWTGRTLRALAERCLGISDQLVVLAHADQVCHALHRPPCGLNPDRLITMVKLTLQEPHREAAVAFPGGGVLRVLWRKWPVDGEAGRLWAVQRSRGELIWAGWNPPEGLVYSRLVNGIIDGWLERDLEPWRLDLEWTHLNAPQGPVAMPPRGLAQLVEKAG